MSLNQIQGKKDKISKLQTSFCPKCKKALIEMPISFDSGGNVQFDKLKCTSCGNEISTMSSANGDT